MSNETEPYHPLYLRGIEYFNECDFFEAHEVWEELWADTRGEPRRFYQGMIQAAVALHHFGNGNIGGARKVYNSCRTYLDEYAPEYSGLSLDTFLAELETCFREVIDSDERLPEIAIDPERIPEIHLTPADASQAS